ncbi:MAG: transglutaminase domain-containing protein [Planctomycetota bacterium]
MRAHFGLASLAGVLSILACTAMPPAASAQAVIRQREPERWTLSFRVDIRAWQDFGSVRAKRAAEHDVWTFDNASVVVPVLERTSTHRVDPRGLSIEVTLDDRPAPPAVAEPVRLIPGKHAGSRWGMFAMGEGMGREIRVQMKLPMTSYAVEVDDEAAIAMEWPQGDWPADAASALLPQMGIELDLAGEPYQGLDRAQEKVERLLQTLGREPREVPPYLVAKFLTAQVWRHIRNTNGNGLQYNRLGEIEGIGLQGVPWTISGRGRTNEFDACSMLVYVLRQAGLPARLVLGVIADVEFDDEDMIARDDDDEDDIICWVEFALVERGRSVWIPIDLIGLMDRSSRAPDVSKYEELARPWKGFGTIEDSDRWAPFSHHFHPPLTVKAYGSPGFWGIFAEPTEPGRATQAITFDVTRTPTTAESQREMQQQRQRQRRSR